MQGKKDYQEKLFVDFSFVGKSFRKIISTEAKSNIGFVLFAKYD